MFNVLDFMAHKLSPLHVPNYYHYLEYISPLMSFERGNPSKSGLGTGCLNSNKYGTL